MKKITLEEVDKRLEEHNHTITVTGETYAHFFVAYSGPHRTIGFRQCDESGFDPRGYSRIVKLDIFEIVES